MRSLLSISALLLLSHFSFAQADLHCRIMGNVFITQEKSQAQFSFYVEESEAFADLLVFWEDSRVFADRPGLWHRVESPALADFILFEEKERGYAHFRLHFTELESIAGCQ